MNSPCDITLDFTKGVQIYDQYANTNVSTLVQKLMMHANQHIASPLLKTACEVMMLRNATGLFLDGYGKLLGIPRNLVINDRYERLVVQPAGLSKLELISEGKYLITLDDDAYRTVLIIKAQLYNTMANAVTKVNLLQKILSSQVTAYDPQNMSYQLFYFLDEIPMYLGLIIEQYNLLPFPAGVLSSFISAIFRYIGFKANEGGTNPQFSAFWKALFYVATCPSYTTMTTPWYYLSDDLLTQAQRAQRNKDKEVLASEVLSFQKSHELFTVNAQQASVYLQQMQTELANLKGWHAMNTELINSLSKYYRVTSHIPRALDTVPDYLAPELPKPTIQNYKSVMYYLHHRAVNYIAIDSYEYNNLLYADEEFNLNSTNHFYYTTENWDDPNLVDYITDIMDTHVGKLMHNHLDRLPISHTGDPKLSTELIVTAGGGVIRSDTIHSPFANYWTSYLNEKGIHTPVDRYNIQAAAYYAASFRQWKAFIDYYDLKYMDAYREFATYQCVLESDIQTKTELIATYEADITKLVNQDEIQYKRNQIASVEGEREVQREVLAYYQKNLAYVQQQIAKVDDVIRNMKSIYDNIKNHLHQVHDKIDNAVYSELETRFTVDLAAIKSEYDARRGPYLEPKEHWVEKYNEIKTKHQNAYEEFIKIHQNWENHEAKESPYWHCYYAQAIIRDIIHYNGDDYTSKYPYWHVCGCYNHFYGESSCKTFHDNRGHRGNAAYTNLKDLTHLYNVLRNKSITLIAKINEHKALRDAQEEMTAFYQVYDSPQGLDCYQQLAAWDDSKYFTIS